MTVVSDHARRDDLPDSAGTGPEAPSDAVESVEVYETEDGDGTVFYDAENPLAWVEATRTVSLKEYA